MTQHVYEGAPNLQRKRKVGDGDCVDLIKRYTDAGWTGRYPRVLRNRNAMKNSALGLCAIVLAGGAIAASPTVTIRCPAHVSADTIRVEHAPDGWLAFVPSSLEIRSAELMFGPPTSYKLARSSSYRQFKRRTVSTWELAGLPDTEKWLRCGYGAADEITLSRQLPTAVSECRVTRELDVEDNVTTVEVDCTYIPSPGR